MFPRIFAILSLRTVYVLSFQNQKLSLTTILSKSTPTWFPPPHYSSSSNEFKSRRASTFDTDVPVRINSSDIKTRQDDVQRSIRRRRRIPIPPSQDVNFLLKRTQYLLDLTPTDLDLSSEEGKDDYDNEQNNQRQHGRIKIHRHTFHWLIDAWANSYHPKATFYAHSLLDQMKNLSPALSNDDMSSDVNERQNLIRPNVRSYTKVMNAYSKEGKDDSGDKAFELLQEMINFNDVVQDDTHEGINNYLKPNVMTYACVLEAYANSGTSESAFRAEELCMEMIQNMVADNQLEIHGGSIVESFDGDNQDSNLIQTTTRCYNAVIQAYSKSGMYDRAQRAETFIKQIESLRREQLKEGSTVIIEPNTVNYNTILTAYANSGLPDAAEQTERILKKKMKHPNVISYNSCIDAWAKSGHLDSGEKAYALLREMNELYESNQNADVKPNTRSYNSVMNAYAKSSNRDGPQRAEKILDMMEDLEKNGNKDVKPDFFSFATAINAWGRSYQFGKAQRVLNIFRHMIDLYENGNESVRPNVVIYNSIINACAYTIGDLAEQRKAMEIAHYTLQELEKSPYAKADQVTYGTFLKVCENQMPPSDTRLQLVKLIFKKCVKDGQMGKLVVDQLKSILTSEQYMELTGLSTSDKEKSWKDLPLEWRCNVVEGKKRRKSRFH